MLGEIVKLKMHLFFHLKMPISQKYICPGNEKQGIPHALLSWT